MVLLGLGSNVGDREFNIITAIRQLDQYSGIRIAKLSSLYETKPVGVIHQANFLNAVVSLNTTLQPYLLLKACLAIEAQMGRVRKERWGPRNIDIDILSYHNVFIQDEVLEIPHPRLHERAFVLVPLKEIAGNVPIIRGLTPNELLQQIGDSDVVLFKKVDIGLL
jgi:2-amino-4-hydroxy-6-hydroxymethyldihydropteridine diphosphokinase